MMKKQKIEKRHTQAREQIKDRLKVEGDKISHLRFPQPDAQKKEEFFSINQRSMKALNRKYRDSDIQNV